MSRPVPLTLLDKPRLIKFDYNAFADLEEALDGRPIQVILKQDNIGFSAIRAMLCFGCKHEDPTMTLVKAGLLINEAIQTKGVTLGDLVEPLARAITGSGLFGDEDEVVLKDPNGGLGSKEVH